MHYHIFGEKKIETIYLNDHKEQTNNIIFKLLAMFAFYYDFLYKECFFNLFFFTLPDLYKYIFFF